MSGGSTTQDPGPVPPDWYVKNGLKVYCPDVVEVTVVTVWLVGVSLYINYISTYAGHDAGRLYLSDPTPMVRTAPEIENNELSPVATRSRCWP
jgi:hypothetical protein